MLGLSDICSELTKTILVKSVDKFNLFQKCTSNFPLYLFFRWWNCCSYRNRTRQAGKYTNIFFLLNSTKFSLLFQWGQLNRIDFKKSANSWMF